MIRVISKLVLGLAYSLRKHGKVLFTLSLYPGSSFERGPDVSIRHLQLRGKLSIGAGTSILKGAKFTGLVDVGCYSKVGKNFSCHGKVSIGNYCAIAQDCFVIANSHRMDLPALQIDFQRKIFPGLDLDRQGKVVVGHNVWIGKSVVILPNVTVGNGAVIGAGSVVTKSVEPYSVVAGNPARVIKLRFSPVDIEKIESSQWYIFSPKELSLNRKFFSAEDLGSFDV